MGDEASDERHDILAIENVASLKDTFGFIETKELRRFGMRPRSSVPLSSPLKASSDFSITKLRMVRCLLFFSHLHLKHV